MEKAVPYIDPVFSLVLTVFQPDFVWPRDLVGIELKFSRRSRFGVLYGQGKAFKARWLWPSGHALLENPEAKWAVLQVPSADIVEEDGLYHFTRAKVQFVGSKSEAANFIMHHEPRASSGAVIGAYRTVGDNETVIVGDLGIATAGDQGKAEAGYRGQATAGEYGSAIAGQYGVATAGDHGTASVSDHGEATAGDYGVAETSDGIAKAGVYGEAIDQGSGKAYAGIHGSAWVRDCGTAEAGDYGRATAGYEGTAIVGKHGAAYAGEMGTAEAGDHSTARVRGAGRATAGDHGLAEAGHSGTAVAGNFSTARGKTRSSCDIATVGDFGTAENCDTASAGDFGMAMAVKDATAGHYGTADAIERATAGDFGTAITANETARAGNYGQAQAMTTSGGDVEVGDYGTAFTTRGNARAGDYGTAVSSEEYTAAVGDYGTATAGMGGRAQAGHGGIIQIRWSCEDSYEERTEIGYIGQDGLEPNIAYQLNDQHQFEVVPLQKPTEKRRGLMKGDLILTEGPSSALILSVRPSLRISNSIIPEPAPSIEIGSVISAADWGDKESGTRLRGWLYGYGDLAAMPDWADENAEWFVLEAPIADIDVFDGFCEFSRARVHLIGDLDRAIACIITHEARAIRDEIIGGRRDVGDDKVVRAGNLGRARAGKNGTAVAGIRGIACVGESGVAMAGEFGTATAGDHGSATVARSGTAKVGQYGFAIAGENGSAMAGDHGTAVVGKGGEAIVGKLGIAVAGESGSAIAGEGGHARTGDFGAAIVGVGGTAATGQDGQIIILWWDEKRKCNRAVVGQVGDNGIEANRPYRLNDQRQLEVVENVEEAPTNSLTQMGMDDDANLDLSEQVLTTPNRRRGRGRLASGTPDITDLV